MQLFISHSSADKPFVRNLKEQLEQHKIKVWLDEVDIRVGQSITKEISDAISSTEIFCFIISQNSLNSEWVNREFYSIMPIIISGTAYLIPCRIDNSKLPAIINDIKYADFRKDFSIGMNQLLNGLKIKEEIDFQKKVEQTKNELLDFLDKDELELFIFHFSRKSMFFYETEVNNRKWQGLLIKLKDKAILLGDSEKHERLYWMTSLGKEVYTRIKNTEDTNS